MMTIAFFTTAGEIDIAVDPVRAPITAKNFIANVRHHAYDGATFFRTVTTHPDNQPGKPAGVKIDVIQAGNAPGFKAGPPIAFEPTSVTGITHRDGTVSMARDDNPVSATTEFFICIGAQPSLDDGGHRSKDHRGFAAFGHVTRGMDVVRAIHAAHAVGQELKPPFTITNARILEDRAHA
jgi:peptidyl-prolyl cis-trans isomerase A (cyclophilin A)